MSDSNQDSLHIPADDDFDDEIDVEFDVRRNWIQIHWHSAVGWYHWEADKKMIRETHEKVPLKVNKSNTEKIGKKAEQNVCVAWRCEYLASVCLEL